MTLLTSRWPGRRVLDTGCGAGALAAALLDRGAIVTPTPRHP